MCSTRSKDKRKVRTDIIAKMWISKAIARSRVSKTSFRKASEHAIGALGQCFEEKSVYMQVFVWCRFSGIGERVQGKSCTII